MLQRSGQVGELAGDIIRSKALDLIVERADVTTTDGATMVSTPEGDPAEDREPEPSQMKEGEG
jgi:hypothetical protein